MTKLMKALGVVLTLGLVGCAQDASPETSADCTAQIVFEGREYTEVVATQDAGGADQIVRVFASDDLPADRVEEIRADLEAK